MTPVRISSSRWLARLAVGAILGGAPACVDHPIDIAELDPQIVPPEVWYTIFTAENDDLDVLFVVDDSSSMGEEQATLAANFAAFIDILERPEVDRNYRIGITTTDAGNPLCSASTTDAGALQLRSCRSHLEDFVSEDGEPVDLTETACTALCPDAWAEIETLPTTTAYDATPRSRSWVERVGGVTNLPDGLSTTQALQCLAPQGITGCEFESPLESMWKTLERAATPSDPDFDFIRELAVLMVVFVTDEDDCSYTPGWESMFLPEGNRVFWSDESAPLPSSAACWNAGVACTGTGTYDECHAVDLDVNGEPVAEEDAEELAVLRPVSRYVDALQELEDRKQLLWPSEVLVSIVGGVSSDGGVVYQDAMDDPEFQQDFGIGPGCESASGRAVPPVRLRELADAFALDDWRNMYSICDGDYSEVLEPIAETLVDRVRPGCMPMCVADMDASTPEVVDPSCVLLQSAPNVTGAPADVEVPPCEAGSALPAGHDVCHVALVGDARSDYCADSGFNLEFQLVRREGVYVLPGTEVRASCEASTSKAVDCPELQ